MVTRRDGARLPRRVVNATKLGNRFSPLHLPLLPFRLNYQAPLNIDETMDDDFEELQCEDTMLYGSSQESLTRTAANLSSIEDDQDDAVYGSQTSVQCSYGLAELPQAFAEEANDAAVSSSVSADGGSRFLPKYTSWHALGNHQLTKLVPT